MGLIDRMKAASTTIAEKAQEAGKAGQARLEALAAKRRADHLLAELGAITYAQQIGRSVTGADGRTADLVSQLRQYESEYGPLDAAPGSSFDGPSEG